MTPASAAAAPTAPVRHRVKVRTRADQRSTPARRSNAARSPRERQASARARAAARARSRSSSVSGSSAAVRRERRPGAAPAGVSALPGAAVRSVVAVRDISESSLVRRLTQNRVWVGVLATMLCGIVALNVYSVSLNARAGAASAKIDRLERDNSAIRGEIAERLSSDRVGTIAPTLGMVSVDPTEARYLTTDPNDAAEAARNLGY